ncbi:porin [Flavobacterium sp.]|uniref:porin n=1 Tax=Flavobacterium sp. TaxID=239 RepID=UPI003A8E4434
MIRKFYLSIVFLALSVTVNAQDKQKDTIKDYSAYNRKISTAVFFVGRYNVSFDDNVDYKGTHHADPAQSISNSFDLKYVRLQGTFYLNDKISTSVLVNLADFNQEPTSKVLENAFVKYAYNKYIVLQFGQFRPYFGREDVFAFQLENSYDWSNQYSLFGKNNWQSFQIGAAFLGTLEQSGIPLRYFFTIYNGNGKNQISDNNDQKNYTLRFEYDFLPQYTLGLNGGTSRLAAQTGTAYGVDIQGLTKFSPLFELKTAAEYKRGTNFLDFTASELENPNINDFEMQGFYIVSKLRFNYNKPRIRAFEASFRYEILDPDIAINRNSYQTFTPMLSIIGSGDYNAKISIVGVFNRYKTSIPDSNMHNSSLFITQIQVHF